MDRARFSLGSLFLMILALAVWALTAHALSGASGPIVASTPTTNALRFPLILKDHEGQPSPAPTSTPTPTATSGPTATPTFTPVPSDWWFTSGQEADIILGLHGFEESGGPSFLHHPGQLATDGTHLVVADTRNNRVLIWNTIPVTNYTPADVVVGQPNMNAAGAGLGPDHLNWPVGVATDGTRLIVADSNNHRVLIWNRIPTKNGQPADVVIGQKDFYSREHGSGADRLWWPLSVATDGTRLYVADTRNMRVLIWNSIPTTNGRPADVVVGKPGFSAPAGGQPPSRTNLINPRGVASDGTRLIVSEHHQGNRILIWNRIPTANGQPADVVLGQPDFNSTIDRGPEQGISSPWQVATDGTRLYSTDGNTRVLIWNNFPTTNGQLPDVVVGQPDLRINFPALTREGLGGVWGVASDGQHLFIADTMNSRVVIHNTIPTRNGRPADVVLGQVDFETNAFISRVGLRTAQGLACDPGHLFIAQDYDARLLVHNTMVTESNRPADIVLGQPDFTDWGEDLQADPATIVRPWGMFTDGTRLFAADTGHHRVLIWNTLPKANNAPADIVLGQPDFASPPSVPGGMPNLGECRAGQDGLCEPRDVMYDGQRVFVADSRNNRVLIWNSLPATNGQPADVVLGQPDFNSTGPGAGATGMSFPTHVFSDGQRLFVTDTYNQRVLVWNSIPTTNGQPADLVLGKSGFNAPPQETFFNLPSGIYSDGTHLFLADNSNHRVLIWNAIPTTNGQLPDIVLGQPDFGSRVPATNRDGLFMPTDVCFDGVHLWVSEGKFSDRVVGFSVRPVPGAASK